MLSAPHPGSAALSLPGGHCPQGQMLLEQQDMRTNVAPRLVRRELWEPSHALLRSLDPAELSVLVHNSGDGVRAVMVPIGCVVALR